MLDKKNKDKIGVVYSTNPDFEYTLLTVSEPETPSKNKQSLKISLDKKARAGKQVTLVSDFEGKTGDIIELSKIIKTKCGVGGSVKDREIIIQGDFRQKVSKILTDLGYKNKVI